jgi:hypothetical protein
MQLVVAPTQESRFIAVIVIVEFYVGGTWLLNSWTILVDALCRRRSSGSKVD